MLRRDHPRTLAIVAWVALCVASTLLTPAPLRSQVNVRVMAETRIDVAAERAGNAVQVLGVLRDDLGQALPRSELEVVTRATDQRPTPGGALPPPGTFGTQLVTTDERGAFTLTVSWTSTPFQVTCAFAGDEFHLGSTVERSVDPTLADVRLRFDLEVTGRELDLDAPEPRVRVLAESSQGGSGLPLVLRDELGRDCATATTDASGYALFSLTDTTDASPGPGRWVVVFQGDAARSAARAELAIVRTRATVLEARLVDDSVDPGDEVTVEGTLRDARGPIHHGAVSVYAGDEHLLTVVTGPDGGFRATFEVPREQEASTWAIEARFAPEALGLRPSRSAPLSVHVGSPLALDWLWLLLPLALSALAVLVTRRRERGGERPSSHALPATPGVTVGPRGPATHRHDVLGGTVLDHPSDRARPGARVSASRVGGLSQETVETTTDTLGRFSIHELPPGEYRLRVLLTGYVEVDQRVQVPHRGEWSDIVVRVESYRTRALSVFRRVGRRFVSSERVFETTTNRELPASAPEAQQGALLALAEHTDRLYYGPRDPEAGDLPPLEEAATALVEALPPAPAPGSSDE